MDEEGEHRANREERMGGQTMEDGGFRLQWKMIDVPASLSSPLKENCVHTKSSEKSASLFTHVRTLDTEACCNIRLY